MANVHAGGSAMWERRGFTISPMLLLLAAALVGLLAWKAYVRLDNIPANYPFAAKARSQTITNSVVTVLVIGALAGGIGAACYFGFRRSERAANAGIGAVLLLGVGTFSYQAYNYLANGPGTRPSPASTAAAQSTGSAVDMQQGARVAQERMAEDQRRALDRAREAMESLSRPVVPARAPASAPSEPAPALPDPPVVRTPSSRPSEPPPRSPSPTITETLQALTADVDAAVSDVVSKLRAFSESVAKPPPRSMPVMDQRAADAKALKSAAVALEGRLRGLDDEAERRLAAAGVDSMASMGERIRFVGSYKAGLRAMACGELERMCDDVVEESELLKRGFSNWKYDASGNVSSKDHTLQHKARFARQKIDQAVRQVDDAVRRLEGK